MGFFDSLARAGRRAQERVPQAVLVCIQVRDAFDYVLADDVVRLWSTQTGELRPYGGDIRLEIIRSGTPFSITARVFGVPVPLGVPQIGRLNRGDTLTLRMQVVCRIHADPVPGVVDNAV